MATVKQLEKVVNELQEQVATLAKQIEALSGLSTRVGQMRDSIEDINREHANSNKRIQSDIQHIVDRMSNSPTRIL